MPASFLQRPALLTAPDGGLPGVPGSGGSSGGGLPGIPGSGPSGQPAPVVQPAPSGEQPLPSYAAPQPASGLPAGVTYELASWGRRFGALIIDWILMWILLIPVIAIAHAIGLDTGSSSGDGSSFQFSVQNGAVFVIFGLWLLVSLLYAPTSMTALQGSTPGKLAVGIKVVRADGGPMTFGFAAKRELLFKGVVLGVANFATFGLAFLLNYLWPLWDGENRALHDMAARSRVVRR